MHAMREAVAVAPASRRLRRAAAALACLAAVLLAHGLLWVAVAPGAPPSGAPRAAVLVRHVTVSAPAAVTPAPQVAAVPTPAPVPPAAPALAPALNRLSAASGRAAGVPPAAERAREVAAVDAAVATAVATAADPSAADGQRGAPAGADAPETSPVATYPTRIPSSTQLHFVLQRGNAAGEATLQWQVDGDRYVLQVQATLPQGRVLEQRSSGGFDEAGLAPLRLADRRRGRDVRAANFQREQGKISFSGPRAQWPLHAGAQDRLSWLVQLVAIAAASPDAMHEGAELAMWVVGTRGAVSVWRFEVRGRQPLAAPGGDALAWWLVREPEHPYDSRVEVWLDPLRGHWPLRLRQTQVPGGEPLEWTLRDEPQTGLGS